MSKQLTFAEQFDRDRKGRTQTYIIEQMNKMGCNLTDTTFSRKKNGKSEFTPEELKILKKVLRAS